jgi:3-oxoadipate enol-lactonase
VLERSRDPVEGLSLGNQQRVQLAAALVHQPELLVLDEPFAGLDPVGVDVLSEVLLAEAHERGVPVLFASHQLELVERLCDAVAIIREGASVAEGEVVRLRAESAGNLWRVEVAPSDGDWDASLRGVRPVGDGLFALEDGATPRRCSTRPVVALLMCLEHPVQVAGLVLSAGVACPPRWFAVQRTVSRITPEPLLARMLAGPYSGGTAEHVRVAAQDFRRCGKPTYLAGLREISRIDLRPRLGQVGVPTLVLCGSNDRPNIPLTRDLAAGIPGAELRIVPDATHLWNLQQPEAFNRTVADFVDRAEPAEP